MIYCARPKLMTFWQRIDSGGQGLHAPEWKGVRVGTREPKSKKRWSKREIKGLDQSNVYIRYHKIMK